MLDTYICIVTLNIPSCQVEESSMQYNTMQSDYHISLTSYVDGKSFSLVSRMGLAQSANVL